MVAVEGVLQDLPAVEVDMGGGVMIEEEDMIVDIPREADIVEDIEVDLGDILHIESFRGRLGGPGHYRIKTNERTRRIRKVTDADADIYTILQE